MRPFGTLGLVAAAFGLASYQVLEEWNAFNVANLAAGGAAMAAGAWGALRRLRARTTPVDRDIAIDAVLSAVAVVWGAVLVQLLVSVWGPRFDWTFERRYELAPATLEVLAELSARGPVELTLYFSAGDPRRRATRMLLEQMARGHDVAVDERDLETSPEEEDTYGIGSSNSVVVAQGGRWELVERPSEGALYEALARLRDPKSEILYVSAGTGEGDMTRSGDADFSGLRAALETEGYRVRPLPTALVDEVPEDADALLVIAPQRRLAENALAAIRRWLDERGGRLIAMLEPGSESGIEEILADYGLHSPDEVVIDPASGAIEGDAAGLNPIANAYADHPVSRGLDANRMTFFRHARSFVLRKSRPEDHVGAAVYTSGDAWLHPDTSTLNRERTPERTPDRAGDYRALVVAGSYERGGRQARIVAFGDSTFASNRYLRALYNLDLAMNAVHWALEREPAITLRPKTGGLLQFPVPIQNALNALYGIGLLVPELLVLTGAWVWLRRRGA
jgi:hypothetical protein